MYVRRAHIRPVMVVFTMIKVLAPSATLGIELI